VLRPKIWKNILDKSVTLNLNCDSAQNRTESLNEFAPELIPAWGSSSPLTQQRV
jgi:hypothetical protein